MIKEAIAKLTEKKDLTSEEAEAVMNEIMEGKSHDGEIGDFLIALKEKKETVEEIAACAKVMREKAARINPSNKNDLVDVVGTGGDGSNTFNISTTTAFVVAGAGVPVAKHGNKSVSSKSGAADLLMELGVNIMLEPSKVEKCIEEIGIGFMFAPKFHPAMKYAMPARKMLATRTVFNILGPLTNPAEAPYELMGVFSPELVEPLAKVLGKLGCKHAVVVHGNGCDEIVLDGTTKVSEFKDGEIKNYEINPEDYGFKISSRDEIKGGSPEENKNITIDILEGIEQGPKRDVVILNAAATIYAAQKADSIKDAIKLAVESIDSGKAMEKLEKLKKFTNDTR